MIVKYRECEYGDIDEDICKRVRSHLIAELDCWEGSSPKWLPCHAIDLAADGALNAHVDSIRFSGHIVAGLSLGSSSIMRLIPSEAGSENQGHVDLYLPPESLYILSGQSRFDYTHELLPDGAQFQLGDETISVARERRFSIIFRDAKAGEK